MNGLNGLPRSSVVLVDKISESLDRSSPVLKPKDILSGDAKRIIMTQTRTVSITR